LQPNDRWPLIAQTADELSISWQDAHVVCGEAVSHTTSSPANTRRREPPMTTMRFNNLRGDFMSMPVESSDRCVD